MHRAWNADRPVLCCQSCRGSSLRRKPSIAVRIGAFVKQSLERTFNCRSHSCIREAMFGENFRWHIAFVNQSSEKTLRLLIAFVHSEHLAHVFFFTGRKQLEASGKNNFSNKSDHDIMLRINQKSPNSMNTIGPSNLSFTILSSKAIRVGIHVKNQPFPATPLSGGVLILMCEKPTISCHSP